MLIKLDTSSRIILKAVLALLILGFLWLVRDIIIILLLSFVLASAMEPLVDYLKVKKVPRSLTVLGVYVAVLSLVGFIFYLIVPLVVEQFGVLLQNLPAYITELQDKLPFLQSLIDPSSLVGELHIFGIDDISVFVQTFNIFSLFFYIVTILVISFYLVAEEQGMKKFIYTLVPASNRTQVLSVVVKIQKKMGMWVLGQFVLSISIFSVTYLVLTLLGVQYALFLALLAGSLEIIPYIGPTISAVPAIFFAFLQSPALALFVVIAYVLIQKAEGLILVPKVMEKAVGISPLAVLIALLVGFKIAGIAGLLLAVPLVGILNVIFEEYSN